MERSRRRGKEGMEKETMIYFRWLDHALDSLNDVIVAVRRRGRKEQGTEKRRKKREKRRPFPR